MTQNCQNDTTDENDTKLSKIFFRNTILMLLSALMFTSGLRKNKFDLLVQQAENIQENNVTLQKHFDSRFNVTSKI